MKYALIILILALETYGLADNSGLLKGRYNLGFLGYYTNLSNILVWLYFLLVLFNAELVTSKPVVSLIVTMVIMLTNLIYHFLLSPTDFKNYKLKKISWNPHGLTNLSLHYFCPLLTILYFFVYVDRSTLTLIDGLYWIIIPIVYIFYIMLRAKLNIRISLSGEVYPYDFMNVNKIGAKKVAFNCVALCLLFTILGLLVTLLAMHI